MPEPTWGSRLLEEHMYVEIVSANIAYGKTPVGLVFQSPFDVKHFQKMFYILASELLFYANF